MLPLTAERRRSSSKEAVHSAASSAINGAGEAASWVKLGVTVMVVGHELGDDAKAGGQMV